MRPSDQHQQGAMRPDLLSGARRHGGGDDNILERLERDCARHASDNRSRAAWYGGAAALLLLLVLALAWSAYDNFSTVRIIPMQSLPAPGSAAPVAANAAATSSVPGPAMAPAMQALPPAPAPVAASQVDTVTALPPLVLLRPHAALSHTPPAPARTAERSAIAPAAQTRPTLRTGNRAPPAASSVRSATRTSASMAKHTPGHGPVPTDAGVDTDVALLSAIIIHDSSHADEKAQLEAAAACLRTGARRCATHPDGGAVMAN